MVIEKCFNPEIKSRRIAAARKINSRRRFFISIIGDSSKISTKSKTARAKNLNITP